MAGPVVTRIASETSTEDLAISSTDYTTLLPDIEFTLTATDTITILAHNDLNPSNSNAQLIVDSEDLLHNAGLGGMPLIHNVVLGAGDHTIQYTGLDFDPDFVSSDRGITVLNITGNSE